MNKPFDMGINAFKEMLKQTKLSKAQKNKAVKAYKARVTERLLEIKSKLEEKDVLDNNANRPE